MAPENKLGITDSAELARTEERISKIKAIELYESDIAQKLEIGKFSGLAKIHKFLFDEIYDFAVKVAESRIVTVFKLFIAFHSMNILYTFTLNWLWIPTLSFISS